MGNWPGDQSPGYEDYGQPSTWDSGAAAGGARDRIQPPPTAEQPLADQQPGYPGQYGYGPQPGAQIQQYAQPNAWAAPYAAPYAVPQQNVYIAAQPQSSGMAVASLVLGITSIFFCWWGIFSLAQVILAIVFGCIALSQANRLAVKAPLAIGGIICGSVGFICYLIFGILTLGFGLLL